jgi:hypothetical protein
VEEGGGKWRNDSEFSGVASTEEPLLTFVRVLPACDPERITKMYEIHLISFYVEI